MFRRAVLQARNRFFRFVRGPKGPWNESEVTPPEEDEFSLDFSQPKNSQYLPMF